MREAPRNKGFSLLEAMVALFILTIGIFALSKLLQVSLNYNAISVQQQNADVVAQEIFEQLKGAVASTNNIQNIANLNNPTKFVLLPDPNNSEFWGNDWAFTEAARDLSCNSGVGNCVEATGSYGAVSQPDGTNYAGIFYRWMVNDSQKVNGLVDSYGGNTWRVYVAVGWSSGWQDPQGNWHGLCSGQDAWDCPNSTQLTNFLVP
ncbi:MAG: prepilin-type N-terminal cleavage/methylation domain-containing protein [Desulfomonilaceae bacterium]